MHHRRIKLSSLIAVGLATAFCAGQDAVVSPSTSVEKEIRHAETYYWLGMAEQGNLAAFRKGSQHLDRARRMIKAADLSMDVRTSLDSQVATLQTDLDEQVEIAHDTLYGLFPLTRFLHRSIFAESTTLFTYELIDDPTVMASTFAAKNLAMETIKQWTQRHQLDVVFTSVPHNPSLENESLYVFNSHPKYFVHNLREVADALDKDDLQDFQSGQASPQARERLLDAFGIYDVLVVTIREADRIDGDFFYILEGKIYRSQQSAPTHSFAVMGFSRDRNSQFYPIVLTNMLFLGLAYFAFWMQSNVRRRVAVRASATASILLPLLGFTVGRCMPWFLSPLLASVAPIPETLAIVSFWLPCVAGASMTVLPMFVFWLVAKRLSGIWPIFNLNGRVVSVFIAISAGAAAHIAVFLFLYLQGDAIFVLFPSVASMAGVALLLGRALDGVDRLSTYASFVPMAMALPLGAVMFQANAGWAWTAAVGVVCICLAPVVVSSLRRGFESRPSAGTSHADAAGTISQAAPVQPIDGQLGERIETPRYQRLPAFLELLKAVEPAMGGRTVHLGIYGVPGSGLTATVRELVADIVQSTPTDGKAAVAMCGECSHGVGEQTPYGPFQKALAQHFEIGLLAAPESKLSEIDAALGGVFQSVLPFAGILFPSEAGAASQAASPEQVVSSIAWMLRRLSRTAPVVLMIDDAQWLDESSRALLRHLIREFPAGGDAAITLLVSSHDRRCLAELGLGAGQIAHWPSPSPEEQILILHQGLGLTAATAEQILSRLGSSVESQGGLFWLLQVVACLDRAGALRSTDDGLTLEGNLWPRNIEVPSEMRDVLLEQLVHRPDYRTVIECAACACDAREFSASLLAEALETPRLQLLADLDRLDRETSIICDVRDRDDAFAFQSSFILDVVRKELRIVERGSTSAEAPQIVREYHARLGAALERSQRTDANRVYAMANHFYSAGASFADRGMKYCIEAAQTAAGVLDFEAAENYLCRAEECSRLIGETDLVQAERLDIDCRRVHLAGQADEVLQLAEEGAAYVRRHADCSTRLLLSIAQVHYDAGKIRGDSSWHERSLKIGQRIIDGASDSQDEAIGRHFVGISLPRSQVGERRAQLRQALQLVNSTLDDRRDFALLGRIMGSLAEELSLGDADERREARELFEHRLQLNEQHQVGDPRGQAMTHGGLGRLAFFYEPKDLAAASRHFERDLEISTAIGDRVGQVQMHSLLGAVALEQDDVERATDHYQASWQLAQYPINLFFAGAGLITCHARRGQGDECGRVIERLLSLAGDGVPRPCAQDLVIALEACPEEFRNASAVRLLSLAKGEEEGGR